jgi:hypothetical protein
MVVGSRAGWWMVVGESSMGWGMVDCLEKCYYRKIWGVKPREWGFLGKGAEVSLGYHL